jgi:hypothetical protein
MFADTTRINRDSRFPAMQGILDVLKQKESLPMASEAFADFDLKELQSEVEAQNETAQNADTLQAAVEQLKLIHVAALKRDLDYANVRRRKLYALGYHDAMLRTYRPSRIANIFGFK